MTQKTVQVHKIDKYCNVIQTVPSHCALSADVKQTRTSTSKVNQGCSGLCCHTVVCEPQQHRQVQFS